MNIIDNIKETNIYVKKINVINLKPTENLGSCDDNISVTMPVKDRAKLGISVGLANKSKDNIILEIEYQFIANEFLTEVDMVFNGLIKFKEELDTSPSQDDVTNIIDKKIKCKLDKKIEDLNKVLDTDMPVISEIMDKPKVEENDDKLSS